ncbi:MAG: hypothetical protein KatS3mg113_1076 [Planctomycetaceae bacterium]|nr:MAG: hypothetical protein KatS3mg113_1076 [Planctomycetaceae bacterium]
MLVIPGPYGKDTCDGFTRREWLCIGGSTVMGLSLGQLLQQSRAQAHDETRYGGPGFGKAKHVIMIYLQGGPSHLDLWDPKHDVPDNVKSPFKPIDTKLSGVQFTELLPKLAQVVDKATLLRAVSYTPVGLFNHTAAIYQIMTGYTADKVSPSGQLEPPSPKDFPNYGCHIVKARPPEVPMLPFAMMPRPLQESGVIGKGGTAGFLGRAYDPYTLYPPGDDLDMKKMDKIRVDDLTLRPEVPQERLARRAQLRETIKASFADLDRAVSRYALDEYYGKALSLVLSGRARAAFDLQAEPSSVRERYGMNTFGQSCLLARRLIEAGTRVVQVNWPKVANSDRHSWDVHTGLTARMKNEAAPMLDAGLSALLEDLDDRGLLAETIVLAIGEFGRSPKRGVSTSGNSNSDDGRDHWPYCYTALIAGAGVKRGFVWGKSDQTGSAPVENPVHPCELVATIYHSVGLNPRRTIYNHLNQPREMVPADAVMGILG